MLSAEKEREYDRLVNLADYLASFWNSEAVAKIKEIREQKENERFMSDEEFEEMIQNRDFEDSELVKSIIESNKNLHTNYNSEGIGNDIAGDRYKRMPRNLSDLSSYIKNED